MARNEWNILQQFIFSIYTHTSFPLHLVEGWRQRFSLAHYKTETNTIGSRQRNISSPFTLQAAVFIHFNKVYLVSDRMNATEVTLTGQSMRSIPYPMNGTLHVLNCLLYINKDFFDCSAAGGFDREWKTVTNVRTYISF